MRHGVECGAMSFMTTDPDHDKAAHDKAATSFEDLDNGLDDRGRIRREGNLSRVDAAFMPLLSDTESALNDLLGRRLHSIYLYGSVPCGTAAVGVSDLDVEVVLRDEPTDRERADIKCLGAALDSRPALGSVGAGSTADRPPRVRTTTRRPASWNLLHRGGWPNTSESPEQGPSVLAPQSFCGKPRLMPPWLGSSQRLVITLLRVKK